MGLTEIVPFLLESKLIERGANFTKVPNFQVCVVASERPVTGQNPASAAGVGHKMVELIKNKYSPNKDHTEKPGLLNNTFAPKSKCSKKVGWVEALVSNAINFKFEIGDLRFLLPSKISHLKSVVGFASQEPNVF
ncbi:hypothetical protein [Microcoleus sp. D3_18a_C4]|uniref:hypothetical protein n=1 Tax=Microcoleus sp. D3_18a_C4 TaxID=3055332 RepID=UPI002FD2D29C